jgi:hypothetical protein
MKSAIMDYGSQQKMKQIADIDGENKESNKSNEAVDAFARPAAEKEKVKIQPRSRCTFS